MSSSLLNGDHPQPPVSSVSSRSVKALDQTQHTLFMSLFLSNCKIIMSVVVGSVVVPKLMSYDIALLLCNLTLVGWLGCIALVHCSSINSARSLGKIGSPNGWIMVVAYI